MVNESQNSYGNVLIAEGDSAHAYSLCAMLQRTGYNVTVRSNSKKALEEYGKFNYDVVITDLNLPLMRGKAFLRELAKPEKTSVILVEADNDSQYSLTELREMGAWDYILKPAGEKDLKTKVSKAVKAAQKKQVIPESRLPLETLLNNPDTLQPSSDKSTEKPVFSESLKKFEKISIKNFYNEILLVMQENLEDIKSGSHEVLSNDPGHLCDKNYVMVNRDSFRTGVEELLFNSLSVSDPGSDIYLICNCSNDYFHISLINRSGTSWSGAESAVNSVAEKAIENNRGKIIYRQVTGNYFKAMDPNAEYNESEIRLPVYYQKPGLVYLKKNNG